MSLSLCNFLRCCAASKLRFKASDWSEAAHAGTPPCLLIVASQFFEANRDGLRILGRRPHYGLLTCDVQPLKRFAVGQCTCATGDITADGHEKRRSLLVGGVYVRSLVSSMILSFLCSMSTCSSSGKHCASPALYASARSPRSLATRRRMLGAWLS